MFIEPKPMPVKKERNFTTVRSGLASLGIKAIKQALQSYDYVSGSTGWKIYANGDVEFNDGDFRGTLTATTGTIGGWTIGATTISSAASGERVILDSGNKRIDLINSSASTVLQMNYGSTETSPILNINVQDNRRIGLKVTTAAITGTGISHSIAIDCDANDESIFGLDIDRDGSSASNLFGATISAANAGAGSAIALDLNAPTGLRIVNASVKGIDIGTTANGITIAQTGSSASSTILIDNDSSSSSSFGMDIDRDANSADPIYSLIVRCDNITGNAIGIDISCDAGAGSIATGIRFNTYDRIFSCGADATDPTGGGGAATGRIPITVGGALKYLAYY